jgi:hypothetical protein
MPAASSFPWHPVRIICPHCEAIQSVAVVWHPEFSIELKQKVSCASCLEPFEAAFPGRIVRGPLLAVPQNSAE